MTPLIYGPGPEQPPALRPQPDLSGLPVDDVGGRPSGEVYGVLVETDSGLIRYLDLAVEPAKRHVLVPVGHIRIGEHADGLRVALRAVTREDLERIPEHRGGEAPADAYESELLTAYSRLVYGERYYAHPAFDHTHLYAGQHPVVPGDGGASLATTLGLLSMQPEWRVARGEPDLRSWPVMDDAGADAGAVRDLMIDPPARKVRYLLVDVEGHGSILVPVGYARVLPSDRVVRLDGLRVADLRALPTYAGSGGLSRPEEAALREALDAALSGGRRYDRADFRQP